MAKKLEIKNKITKRKREKLTEGLSMDDRIAIDKNILNKVLDSARKKKLATICQLVTAH